MKDGSYNGSLVDSYRHLVACLLTHSMIDDESTEPAIEDFAANMPQELSRILDEIQRWQHIDHHNLGLFDGPSPVLADSCEHFGCRK